MTNQNGNFAQKAAIATGAALVGAAAGAAAVAMIDPAIKKKVVKSFDNFKSGLTDKRDELIDKVEDAKKEVVNKLS